MKKLILKGLIVGVIIALAIVVYFVNFPKYTCQKAPAGQPVNCHRVVEVTPGFILESFIVFMVIGGGVGLIYGRARRGTVTK